MLKEQIEKEEKRKLDVQKMEEQTQFTSSKYFKANIFLFVFCLILVFMFFKNFKIIRGMIALVQVGMLGCAWLMGMRYIEEKVKNMHIGLIFLSAVLFVPLILLPKGNSSSNKKENISDHTHIAVTIPTIDEYSKTDEKEGIYSFSIKDYSGRNIADIGSLNGSRKIDEYGSTSLNLVFVTPNGKFINIVDEKEQRQYVVVDQNIPADTNFVYVTKRDSNNEPYKSLVLYQNYEEIVLFVKEVGSDKVVKNNLEFINPTNDKHVYHIRDYTGRNLASFSNINAGKRYDTYGPANVKLSFSIENGNYIDPKNLSELRNYVVVSQDVKPNTELQYIFTKDSDGDEYDTLITQQNVEEIVLNVKKIDQSIIESYPELVLQEEDDEGENEDDETVYEYHENIWGELTITGYTGKDKDLDIPRKINDKKVVKIGDGAFENLDIKSVYFFADVVEIGDNAFKNCKSLESIDIPNETKKIGKSAFEGCSRLKDIIIWGDISKFEDKVFKGCTSLTEIDIPNETVYIGKSAFEGCSKLESVIVWGDVETFDEKAFKDCTSLTDIDIPNETRFIKSKAFYNCKNLEDVTVWSNEIDIAKDAFLECPKLKDIPKSK